MTDTHTDHTHLEDSDVEAQEPIRPWCRVFIDDPNYLNERGERIPRMLAGGSREHCESVLKEYRRTNYKATQWPSKIIELTEDQIGKEVKVVFER
jgi:hypothetical protein